MVREIDEILPGFDMLDVMMKISPQFQIDYKYAEKLYELRSQLKRKIISYRKYVKWLIKVITKTDCVRFRKNILIGFSAHVGNLRNAQKKYYDLMELIKFYVWDQNQAKARLSIGVSEDTRRLLDERRDNRNGENIRLITNVNRSNERIINSKRIIDEYESGIGSRSRYKLINGHKVSVNAEQDQIELRRGKHRNQEKKQQKEEEGGITYSHFRVQMDYEGKAKEDVERPSLIGKITSFLKKDILCKTTIAIGVAGPNSYLDNYYERKAGRQCFNGIQNINSVPVFNCEDFKIDTKLYGSAPGIEHNQNRIDAVNILRSCRTRLLLPSYQAEDYQSVKEVKGGGMIMMDDLTHSQFYILSIAYNKTMIGINTERRSIAMCTKSAESDLGRLKKYLQSELMLSERKWDFAIINDRIMSALLYDEMVNIHGAEDAILLPRKLPYARHGPIAINDSVEEVYYSDVEHLMGDDAYASYLPRNAGEGGSSEDEEERDEVGDYSDDDLCPGTGVPGDAYERPMIIRKMVNNKFKEYERKRSNGLYVYPHHVGYPPTSDEDDEESSDSDEEEEEESTDNSNGTFDDYFPNEKELRRARNHNNSRSHDNDDIIITPTYKSNGHYRRRLNDEEDKPLISFEDQMLMEHADFEYRRKPKRGRKKGDKEKEEQDEDD